MLLTTLKCPDHATPHGFQRENSVTLVDESILSSIDEE
jgi:hypothetical protein